MAKKLDINQVHERSESSYIHAPVKSTVFFLIVSVGTKTAPNYFGTFIGRRGSKVVSVKCKGKGKSTTQLLSEAKKIQEEDRRRGKEYDSVWIVFDKDNFSDAAFNRAIEEGPKQDVYVAWSNPSFEIWYLLHLCDTTKELTPAECIQELEKAVKKDIKQFKYDKASKDFSWLNREENQSKAIKRAEKLRNHHEDKLCSKQNPCTTVDKLVRQLIGEDKEFNTLISERM